MSRTLPIHIFDGLFFASTGKVSAYNATGTALDVLKAMRSKIEEGIRTKALQRLPHITLLNIEWYHSSLKPLVARWVYFWLQDQRLHGITREEAEMYILEGGLAQSETSEHVAAIEAALAEREATPVTEGGARNEVEAEKKELRLALEAGRRQLELFSQLFELDKQVFALSHAAAKRAQQLTEKSLMVQKRILELETPRDDSCGPRSEPCVVAWRGYQFFSCR